MFCGAYSDSQSGECGLPRALDEIAQIRTGWRWAPNANTGQYNAAYDIWLGNGTTVAGHSAFLMIWLRDPPGFQPAGTRNGPSCATITSGRRTPPIPVRALT